MNDYKLKNNKDRKFKIFEVCYHPILIIYQNKKPTNNVCRFYLSDHFVSATKIKLNERKLTNDVYYWARKLAQYYYNT